ncbi:MAG: hypothetical protein H6696_14810 [Deferribacteres bacterium]|nr:hypothetical protein [candidate division KSB1 bacterium]MCB9503199.1 hypothetical protein [Deferribacteres bacterium]
MKYVIVILLNIGLLAFIGCSQSKTVAPDSQQEQNMEVQSNVVEQLNAMIKEKDSGFTKLSQEDQQWIQGLIAPKVAKTAESQITYVTGVIDFSPWTQIDPGTVWFDNNGLMHIEGQKNRYPVTGGTAGWSDITTNWIINPVTFNGFGWGPFVFNGECTSCPGSLSGTFQGFAFAQMTAGILTGGFVSKGNGGFDDMYYLGIFQQTTSGPDPVLMNYQGLVVD